MPTMYVIGSPTSHATAVHGAPTNHGRANGAPAVMGALVALLSDDTVVVRKPRARSVVRDHARARRAMFARALAREGSYLR
jgi:hypothetical protein